MARKQRLSPSLCKTVGAVVAIRKIRLTDERFYWLLVLPSLLIFLGFGVYPFISTLYLSIHSGSQFVGFSNYRSILGTQVVLLALKNTVIFVFGSVAIEFIIGFLSALIMSAAFRGRTAVRIASFLPWAIPIVVAGITFKFMLNDVGGIVNTLLLKMHLIDFPVAWVADKRYAMWTLIVADSWKSFPILAFLLLAGLQQLPRELYEAARIDGATSIKMFFFITLPLLKRVIFVALMIRTMQAVAYAFDIVYSLTKGGPGDLTQVLVSLAQKYSFQFMHFELGAAVAVLALLMGLALGGTFLFLLFRGARE